MNPGERVIHRGTGEKGIVLEKKDHLGSLPPAWSPLLERVKFRARGPAWVARDSLEVRAG